MYEEVIIMVIMDNAQNLLSTENYIQYTIQVYHNRETTYAQEKKKEAGEPTRIWQCRLD